MLRATDGARQRSEIIAFVTQSSRDEAATARDDKERERLRDRDEPEMPSHAAKTRTLSLDSFEISSALSAYDYEKRAPARGDSEFSLDGIEEELRSVDELLKETSAVGT